MKKQNCVKNERFKKSDSFKNEKIQKFKKKVYLLLRRNRWPPQANPVVVKPGEAKRGTGVVPIGGTLLFLPPNWLAFWGGGE